MEQYHSHKMTIFYVLTQLPHRHILQICNPMKFYTIPCFLLIKNRLIIKKGLFSKTFLEASVIQAVIKTTLIYVLNFKSNLVLERYITKKVCIKCC